jgi:hypothetical protein
MAERRRPRISKARLREAGVIQVVRSQPMGDAVTPMRELYARGFVEQCNDKAASGYYGFAWSARGAASREPDSEPEPDSDGGDYMDVDVFEAFYYNSRNAKADFLTATRNLWRRGVELINSDDLSADDYVSASQDILNEGYEQTRLLSVLNNAKAAPTHLASHFTNVQKIQLKQVFDGIGTHKPESFREYIRRNIPRWMWHPLPHPEGELAQEQNGNLRQLWSGYTSQDASLLIHPDPLAEGNAPLHMALTAAQTVENEGNHDLGYAIRTSTILQLLEMEKERVKNDEDPELPFFAYVFAGAMTGEVNHTPKRAHFNYSRAISDTMRHTLSRLQNELERGESSPASEFLQAVSQYYPDVFPELLAKSIKNHERSYSGFDMLTLLRGLNTVQQPWVTGVQEAIDNLPSRRVLTSDEVAHLASYLPETVQTKTSSATSLPDDVKKIVGDNDIFTIKEKIREENGVNIDVSIDIDTVAEALEVKLSYLTGDLIRLVPFVIPFSENGGVHIETIDQVELPPAITDKYRSLVLDGIKRKADEIREREAAKQRGGMGVTSINTSTLPMGEQSKRVKTKGEADPDRNTTVIFTPDMVTEQPTDQRQKITIQGLDIDTITHMLDENAIQAVTPDRLLEKLYHHLNVANVKGKPPGETLSLDGAAGKARNDFDLREIKWRLGHRIQLRVYIYSPTGNSRDYELVSITLKKGDNKQETDLRKLVRQIAGGKRGSNGKEKK